MKSIIDVSSAVYGGHNGADRRIRGFPVGGIRKVFGIINAGLSHSDFALCFDGGEIIKKELLPTYKAGRVPDYSVIAQIDLLKELLTSCDIPFYHDPKYEADDFVFSVCAELLDLGDPEKIVIYSDDRDLSCCVTDQISIQNVTTNGMCITLENYQDRVVRGRTIPYNTILLWKIFHGDPSDNYKALRIPGLNFETVSHHMVSQLEPLINPQGFTPLAYAEYFVLEELLKDYEDMLSPEDLKLFKEQARIAYPYRIPVSDTDIEGYRADAMKGDQLYVLERKHMKFFGAGNFNRSKFDFYCTLLGLNKVKPGRSVDKDSAEAQEFYGLLELRAKELASGVIAVNHQRKKMIRPQGPTLANMDLPI